MSANIYDWRPRVTDCTGVHTDAPQKFMDTLAELVGQRPPLVLDRAHLPGLRALARACPGEASWMQLVNAIESNDAIEITVSY